MTEELTTALAAIREARAAVVRTTLGASRRKRDIQRVRKNLVLRMDELEELLWAEHDG